LSIKNSVCKAPSVSDITVCISPSFLWNRRHKGPRLDDFDELLADDAEVLSFVAAKGSWDVFPQSKAGVFSICCFPHFFDDADGFHKEAAPGCFFVAIGFVLESGTLACHGQVLTRRSKSDDVNGFDLGAVDLADVSQVLHIGEACPGDCDGVGLHLCRPSGLDATQGTRQRKATRSVKKTA
jgi:hypothetical protein